MTSQYPIHVVHVVDDDLLVRVGLERLLRLAGLRVALFGSAEEFLRQLVPDQCGCVILDLALPDMSGLEVQRAIAARGSVMPVIFLTGQGDVPASVKAMKQGAVVFLSKPVSKAELLDTVRPALERSAAYYRERQEIAAIRARHATLTPRERAVMAGVINGKRNKQIAGDLGILECTIKAHRAQVMGKMRAETLANLVKLAQRAGVGAPPEHSEGAARGSAKSPAADTQPAVRD